MDSACKHRVINGKTSAIQDKNLFQLARCPIRHHLNLDLVIRNLSDCILNLG